ncbi:Pre-mRNA-splicing factor ATP-dependent RNA helicase PRP43 [Nosema granulosis]|uniref:Pre-mRNA-splicing factor ATP-dependent RNA helicase PRP43 n=1 Tax=Nosema granulosis TaxID=83296 RepID=A0A9P6KXE8_9MICR|nr:Pre-mRNA-splicing factor ATP-dependent RNA helicase PRP43 [Nosema granulosis]
MNNDYPRKSKGQKSWELRKMQMAGLRIDPNEITDVESCSVDLGYRSSLFVSHKYYASSIENVINTTTEMFRIGNRESKYWESLQDVVDEVEGHYYSPNQPVNLQNPSPTVDYRSLPVYNSKDEFLKFYSSNSVMVVTGETGCGKSTLVPKLIFDRFSHRIAITQPRRISVKSLHKRMQEWYGKEVGYAMRFESCAGWETKIKFMTEGVLLKEIQEDGLLSKYDVVIIDEAHERSVNVDIILGFLKQIHAKRPTLKIIVMSATLNISKFTAFFNCQNFTFDGKRFPVEIKYLEVDVDDYIEWAVKKTLSFVNQSGDILVFLSGKDDIEKVFRLLCYNLRDYKISIIKCYSEILNEVYPLIFSPNRKIILSTNVAEASVTIPDIKYVIDAGFNKILIHDYSQGDVLVRCPISKESAIQRAGRCGRTTPGVCLRMYTRKTFGESFDDFSVPEILRSDIGNLLLLLASMNIPDISLLPLIDAPSPQLVDSCYNFLVLLGALDKKHTLTRLGRLIVDLGVDSITGKMIYESLERGCSYEIVLLVSILSCESSQVMALLGKIRNRQSDFYKQIVENNDLITLINIYKAGCFIEKSLEDNIKLMFKRLCDRINSKLESNPDIKVLNRVLLRSLFFNLSKKEGKEYFNLISRNTFVVPKNTTLEDDAEYVAYYKTFKSKDKRFGYLCMKVDPYDVLKELGEIFEDKKEKVYAKKQNIAFVIDDSNLYDNFELEEDPEEVVKLKRIRRCL